MSDITDIQNDFIEETAAMLGWPHDYQNSPTYDREEILDLDLYDDLGADSLDLIEIGMEMELKHSVEVPDDFWEKPVGEEITLRDAAERFHAMLSEQ